MAQHPKRLAPSLAKKLTVPLTADYRVLSSSPPAASRDAPFRLPLEHTEHLLLQLGLVRKAGLPPNYGLDPSHLTAKFHPQSSTRLCIEIENAHRQAWKVPHAIVPRLPPKRPHAPHPVSESDVSLDYEVVWNDPASFDFSVLRKSSGEKLFDTSSLGLTMKDQYIEFATHLSRGSAQGQTANLFGLGENVGPLRRTPGTTTTLWARDHPCKPDTNLYGCHPFFMQVLPSGSAHGVFLLSSNGMDIVFSPEGDRLTYKVIGGAIELYIFTGPSPQQVIQQYTELIGRPCMIPYFAQGFHICRWGYDTLDKVKDVVSNFEENSLPLEAMWIDIDYMKDYKCFTFDEERFPVKLLAEYANQLHAQNQHLVMILDPGIKVQYQPGLYEPYDEGVAKNLFVKRRITKLEEEENGMLHQGDLVDFVGKVWPGKTTFPDWFHPEAQAYWQKYITRWLQQVSLDGIWLDMNEAASFHDGDCSHIESSEDRPVRVEDFAMAETEDSDDEIIMSSQSDQLHIIDSSGPKPPVIYANPNEPPYRINNNNEHAELGFRTISPDALHYGNVIEYDVHSLYGHMEAIATYNALRELQPNKKPFILSRSTFPGSGRFVCKWNGDNWSTAADMKASIPGLLNFQFFGITMIGADIGGFGDAASEELLIRWHQLGAFYPFMRNHNCLNNPPQEPYIYKALTEVTRAYVDMRYRLLPYWYTLFYRSHQDGSMVCSPIWVLDPTDPDLLSNDEQFLVGEAILVSPALELNQTVVHARFPAGRWYDLHTGVLEAFVQQGEKSTQSKGSTVLTMDAPLNKIPVHLRGGHILPRAGIGRGEFIRTTSQVREAPIEILVALDEMECARGEYYHDDDSFAPNGTLVRFEARPGVLSMSSFATEDPVDPLKEGPKASLVDHDGDDLGVPQGSKALGPTYVQSIVVWGVGMDHVTPGKISDGDSKSSSQVEPHQVRVSIVDVVTPTTKTLQHQRELSRVNPDEFSVQWDSASSQLQVQFRRGGLKVRGDQALEVDWTEALVA
ncbi:MAG: glycosyl hydrolases family 31-domain-containing protein [Benniella sp.]|nr:MAG: glycosyl hydrolases family 31-domain-containing protein [Benniella sp.]